MRVVLLVLAAYAETKLGAFDRGRLGPSNLTKTVFNTAASLRYKFASLYWRDKQNYTPLKQKRDLKKTFAPLNKWQYFVNGLLWVQKPQFVNYYKAPLWIDTWSNEKNMEVSEGPKVQDNPSPTIGLQNHFTMP